MKTNIIGNFQSYLEENLAISVKPEKLQGRTSLPFYLLNNYDFYCASLLDNTYIVLVPKDERRITPALIQDHAKKISEVTGKEIILLMEGLASHNRHRLIKLKVPFVVPKTQMYLPDLGIDLREHFRKLRSIPEFLSPSAQLLVLYILNKRIKAGKTPGEYAKILGYSNMTMSRAFDELEALDLGTFTHSGKERYFFAGEDLKRFWDIAEKHMQSPVKNEIYITALPEKLLNLCYRSEITALSEYTMLSPSQTDTYAMGYEDFKKLQKDKTLEFSESPDEAAAKIQIWKYNPGLLTEKNKDVDKFSLYLSLKNEEDERVQAALETLIGNIEW